MYTAEKAKPTNAAVTVQRILDILQPCPISTETHSNKLAYNSALRQVR